jgi:pimeloyl-ACP methyl ester carboxylesterase
MTRYIIFVVIGVGLVVVAPLLGAHFFQERLVFFPEKLPDTHGFKFSVPFEEVQVFQGVDRIHGIYFKTPHDAVGSVLYFHGNAGSLEGWGAFAEDFVSKSDWNILMMDYPGYGKSTGKIRSEDQLAEIARKFYDLLKSRESKKLVIMGRSLGSAVATRLATEVPANGVVLETPFYSGLEFGQRMFPLLPSFVIRYKFRSDLNLPKITAPILILHGTDDIVVPFAQSEKLQSLAPKNARLVTVRGGNHNDLPTYPEYWKELLRFLKALP